jgi:hypothetical protein
MALSNGPLQRLSNSSLVDLSNGSLTACCGCLQEHYDYISPDDKQVTSKLKILEMAHMWRNQMKRKRL